jgi:hypothetical protein
MFEFKITLDDEDYLLFNQYHLLNSPTGKKLTAFSDEMEKLKFLEFINMKVNILSDTQQA